ncbi:hypothetical protein PAL_GLEAN10004398 [Pteropus alecto]|uniref:Uncharacterized protein n=1 Tax=Pteropus alecto TaxID=9402 RepID=L5L7Y3_PTEAL|nr:hypothetical protein PAL_GLEAN10004398 [Pteropus alecto]
MEWDGALEDRAKGCKADGAEPVPLSGTHAPEAPKRGNARQRPSLAPPLSSKSGSEMAQERTLRIPPNTGCAPTRAPSEVRAGARSPGRTQPWPTMLRAAQLPVP